MTMIAKTIRLLVGSVLLGSLLMIASGVVSSGVASAACYPPGSTGCAGALGTTLTRTVPGGTVTFTGSGFLANSHVTINICNVETISTTANSAGNISVPITIPANAPLGRCVVTATGLNANHQSFTLKTTVVLASSNSVVPPTHTGQPWAGWLYWSLAGGAGVLGFFLLGFGRRRRTHPAS
ncbi:MAG: hypothetical protein ACYCSF_08245 [Acidimicrobiales bacterium]